MDEELGEDGYPPGWPAPLRDLRRVVPIAQTVTVGGIVLMALSLDDFPVGFTVRLRLLLADGHPMVEEQRRQDAEVQHQWAEAARRGVLEADDAEEEATFVGRFLPVPEWELEARDDRGQQYRDWGGESSWGSSLEGRAEPIFTPALDPAAQELRLTVAEVQWRTVAGQEMGEIVAVDRGPWTFAVAL
jgi:hypothetical protein